MFKMSLRANKRGELHFKGIKTLFMAAPWALFISFETSSRPGNDL